MLHIHTRFPSGLAPGYLAWFVKCSLEGFALGCHPAMQVWDLPPLYKSGVRYQLEPDHGSGDDQFDLPPEVYARRWGDCDDLVIWRLAELWKPYDAQKLPGLIASMAVPHCVADWQFGELHVLVRMPNNKTEDPSELLGMR